MSTAQTSSPASILTGVDKQDAINDIQQLKARYCFAVDAAVGDAGKIGALLELMTDDVVLDYGPAGTHAGKEAVDRFYSQTMPTLVVWSFHAAHNPVISITATDRATGDWYLHAHAVYKAALAAGAQSMWGHYHDEYVKTSTGWKISKLVLTLQRVPCG